MTKEERESLEEEFSQLMIPKQTPEDRQQIPKFIITETSELTDEFIEKTIEYLTTNYKHKNKDD